MPTTRKKSNTSAIVSGGRKKKAPPTTTVTTGWRERLKFTFLKDFFKFDKLRFFFGFCLMGISLFLFICLVSNFTTGLADQSGVESGHFENAQNYGGVLGAHLAYYFMNECFGLASIFIPLFLLLASMRVMHAYKVRLWKWFLNFSILMVWISVALSMASQHILPDTFINQFSFELGGKHGDYINHYLTTAIGSIGLSFVMISAAVLYLMYLSSETANYVRRLLHPQDYIKSRLPKRRPEETSEAGCKDENFDLPATNEENGNANDEAERAKYEEDYAVQLALSHETDDGKQPELILGTETEGSIMQSHTATDSSTPPASPSTSTKLTIETGTENEKAHGKTVEEVLSQEPYDPRKDLENYHFPTLSLLKHYEDNGPAIDMAEQNANKDRIITVLRNFGVEISSIKATIGPTITLYEVTPAPGVRINKIRNLEDDIALSLSALGIRIIAPIPGKGTIGIEVPNKNPRIVSMESIINTKKFQESTYELPIALGKTITNEVFMVDLAKMPHLLVAGATGQGKSVGLNAIISSLLYKKHPAELKFVMVDPKKVEFSVYSPIENHFLAKIPEGDDPIITDVTKVVQTLNSLCQLMDHRYDLLKKAKVRNIKEYNAKFKSRMLSPEAGHEFMPYIVVIIDEFGDLIMTAGKEVELPIARIAQLARAVGMHMVIATQRPTTNIITGTIKANFPARMAFKVMSQIDSRTILDRPGANQLVGRGDMLFLSGNDPVRVQCAFIDTPEVEAVNTHICKQQGYPLAYELPEPECGSESSAAEGIETGQLDPMFDEAARLIVIHQQGSTSLIQRKFSIGYNRAGRLMDQLEKTGIVGPVRGSKPREVLCADEIELESRLSAIH